MTEPYSTEIECNGVKLGILFDGFCVTLSVENKYLFAASVNDPTVSDMGNACLLLFDANEVALRLEEAKGKENNGD